MAEPYGVEETESLVAHRLIRSPTEISSVLVIELKQATDRATAANRAFAKARRSALSALERTENLLQEAEVQEDAEV